jgi:CBS domain containing-hemolysin-like protein
MTPRIDLVTVDAGAAPQEILEEAARSGHSRIPVRREDWTTSSGWYMSKTS